jgi:hypothetical protein
MSWFRTRLRLGSFLALFALAFQLAVSFGHVHLDAITSHSSSVVTASASTPPTGDDPRDVADHYCAICALIHSAGTLVLSQPPVVPLPIAFAQTLPDATVRFGFTAPPPAFFPARAPPAA